MPGVRSGATQISGAMAEAHRRDQDEIQQRLAANADFDLAEPFERIREALEEAHKQSR